jgi:hypothetical protein
MTYFELVTYIEDLKDKRITDEEITKINKFDLDYNNDVMVRITDHFINVIFSKLNTIEDDLIINLNSIKTPQELTLKIDNIKESIKDVNKLLKVKYFDEELITYLKENKEKYIESYTNIITNHFKGIKSNEYAMVINNMSFMEEK